MAIDSSSSARSSTPPNPNVFDSIGIDDGGKVVWSKRIQTTPSIGRAMGIVPLAAPGKFLVASHNADETET